MAQGSSRQKRKRKQRARQPSSPEPTATGYARASEKDAEARAALEPLEEGERPLAVTIGAVVALIFAATNLVAYAAGLKVQGDRPAIAGVLTYSGLMLLVAYGMWRAKYWAVLGMEALLGIIVLIFCLLALNAGNAGSLLIALAVIAGAGTLFWFLIKAMARIQMPERPGASRS